MICPGAAVVLSTDHLPVVGALWMKECVNFLAASCIPVLSSDEQRGALSDIKLFSETIVHLRFLPRNSNAYLSKQPLNSIMLK